MPARESMAMMKKKTNGESFWKSMMDSASQNLALADSINNQKQHAKEIDLINKYIQSNQYPDNGQLAVGNPWSADGGSGGSSTATASSTMSIPWRDFSSAVSIDNLGVMLIAGRAGNFINTYYAPNGAWSDQFQSQLAESVLIGIDTSVTDVTFTGSSYALQFGHSCVANTEKVYCSGGFTRDNGAAPTASMFYFSLPKSPSDVTSIPIQSTTGTQTGRGFHSSVLLGGKIYLIGGFNQIFSPIAYSPANSLVFDLTTNTFQPFAVTANSITSGFAGACAVALSDSTALIIGGATADGQPCSQVLLKLDVAKQTLEPVNSSGGGGPQPGWGMSCGITKDGEKVYVQGGTVPGKAPTDANLYILDVNGMSWTSVPTNGGGPGPRAFGTGAVFGDYFLSFGGETAAGSGNGSSAGGAGGSGGSGGGSAAGSSSGSSAGSPSIGGSAADPGAGAFVFSGSQAGWVTGGTTIPALTQPLPTVSTSPSGTTVSPSGSTATKPTTATGSNSGSASSDSNSTPTTTRNSQDPAGNASGSNELPASLIAAIVLGSVTLLLVLVVIVLTIMRSIRHRKRAVAGTTPRNASDGSFGSTKPSAADGFQPLGHDNHYHHEIEVVTGDDMIVPAAKGAGGDKSLPPVPHIGSSLGILPPDSARSSAALAAGGGGVAMASIGAVALANRNSTIRSNNEIDTNKLFADKKHLTIRSSVSSFSFVPSIQDNSSAPSDEVARTESILAHTTTTSTEKSNVFRLKSVQSTDSSGAGSNGMLDVLYDPNMLVDAAVADLVGSPIPSLNRRATGKARKSPGGRKTFDPSCNLLIPLLAPIDESIETDEYMASFSAASDLAQQFETLIFDELGDLHQVTLDHSYPGDMGLEAVSMPLRIWSKTTSNDADVEGVVNIPADMVAGVRFQCMYVHVPRASDEMEIRYGDIIVVKRFFKDGWAEGVNYSLSKEGKFPIFVVEESGTPTLDGASHGTLSSRHEPLHED